MEKKCSAHIFILRSKPFPSGILLFYIDTYVLSVFQQFISILTSLFKDWYLSYYRTLFLSHHMWQEIFFPKKWPDFLVCRLSHLLILQLWNYVIKIIIWLSECIHVYLILFLKKIEELMPLFHFSSRLICIFELWKSYKR